MMKPILFLHSAAPAEHKFAGARDYSEKKALLHCIMKAVFPFSFAQVALLVTTVALMSSCSASLSDYGYAAGGTNTSTVVGSPIVGTNTRTTFEDHHIYFGQGTAQSRFPGGEDMQGYSNPTSRTGQLVADGKDLTSFYVFNGQITSHRNYYFEIAAEADYAYKAAKNEFSYLAFIVGAFPFPSDTKIGV